ncbi:MAG: lytic transglycosylase domain-containing protein [Deltaproteobacteria bacterium]|nr:lytic transglycosylase domain-containing protein [Deltaproteobacteria bacterium]
MSPVFQCSRLTCIAALTCLAMVGAASPVSGEIRGFLDSHGKWNFPELAAFKKRRFVLNASRIHEYEGVIERASEMYGVETPLIKAVIKAESDFNPGAVSSKGARGLMQIMPATAQTLDVENPFDPVENILGGTRYLRQLLGRFREDKNLALAAYNAGPEKVITYRGVPPYPETRTFVRRVLDYYRIYSMDR